jgi:2-phospho-L-lactate guanylyltransferase
MILLPVKDLSRAKQRLAALFDQTIRTELAQAMLLDVLSAIAAWKACPPTALVTSDPFAIQQANSFGFEVIRDERKVSETDAIEMATRVVVTRCIDATLVIPGDVPLLQSAELRLIFDTAPEHGTLLVPAGDGRGTNGVLRRPGDLFPLRFGNDSFQPHLATARATGMPCVVLPVAGLALDIDTPEDLQQLASLPGATRSQQLARKLLAQPTASSAV